MDETLREEAYKGIVQNEFFVPQGAMKDQIKAVKTKVTVRHSELRVKTSWCDAGPSCDYVIFDGKNNAEEKKLFNAVYGTDNPGIGKGVYLLRKDVVEVQLKNRKDDLVVRGCRLDSSDDQYFSAVDMFLMCSDGRLYHHVRGVRRGEVAKGDTPQNSGIAPQETKPDYKDATRFINS